MPLPDRLRLDAWTGGAMGVSGELATSAGNWGLTSPLPRVGKALAPSPIADANDWQDERVGWGLILPENDAISEADRAVAKDAPEAIQELVRMRGMAPVLRYLPDRLDALARHYTNRASQVRDIARSEIGAGEGQIPRYLLIYGSPTEIPWALQYILNARFAVGRLDLKGAALTNYVTALLAGWSKDGPDPLRPLIWASDLDPQDITATMRRVIAKPIAKALAADTDSGPGTLLVDQDSGGATTSALVEALVQRRPGLIISTSHGNMGDAGGGPATADTLGLLVGDDRVTVDLGTLTKEWDPYGAIWYAHACSSAGTSADSVYAGLFKPDSEVATMLGGVANLGSMISPLPTALLGHSRPIRAFVGHVEPTFDWTISEPSTGQALASAFRQALFDNLYQATVRYTLGLAFKAVFEAIGPLAIQVVGLRDDFDRDTGEEGLIDKALAIKLSVRDRMSTVILGDPTVALDLPNRST